MVGIILAVFLYLVLLILLPFALGGWAVLAAVVIALPFIGHLLRGRRAVRRTPVYNPRPEKVPFGPRRGYYLERTAAGLFAVTILVIGLIAAGEFLRVAYGFSPDTVVLSAIGYGLVQAGIWILVGLYDAARWPLNVDYYSSVDTTEDH